MIRPFSTAQLRWKAMAVIPLSPANFPRFESDLVLKPWEIESANSEVPFPLPPGARVPALPEKPALPDPVEVLGLPISPWTKSQVLEFVDWLVQRGQPSFFITANLHYARLTAQLADLKEINKKAAFIVADGMPLLWAARWLGRPLPERVTGADLVWDLSELAASRGYPVFLLGGAPGVAETAARKLVEKFPRLVIAGTAAPMLDTLEPACEAELIRRIRRSGAQILFAAFGQPKGERWLASHIDALGVPVAVQVGAALDFAAGRIRRAPRFLQRIGLEWAYRILCDPRRLTPRYLADGLFFLRALGQLRKE
ncbi:WecB/TagA/CpsF family glycosyltransferase [Thermogutta sp.]|uniref:WecB/TagA/CpsF family glycosyltransferase n=1 Tax=Thermogutta sp. TaxID=1962930 RepID=UPI003C79DE85